MDGGCWPGMSQTTVQFIAERGETRPMLARVSTVVNLDPMNSLCLRRTVAVSDMHSCRPSPILLKARSFAFDLHLVSRKQG
jgi:hypothetical protein